MAVELSLKSGLQDIRSLRPCRGRERSLDVRAARVAQGGAGRFALRELPPGLGDQSGTQTVPVSLRGNPVRPGGGDDELSAVAQAGERDLVGLAPVAGLRVTTVEHRRV